MGYDDFWNHAAVGRWILENKQIPHETLFLWTAKQSWVAHSWGTQLWFGLLMRAGENLGPVLALAFAALMVAATYLVLWRLWIRCGGSPSFAALFFLLAIVAARSRYDVRPELFSALFFSLLLSYLVTRQSAENERFGKVEIAFAILFLIWANLHGAFAIGLVTLLLTFLGDALQDRFDKRSRILLLLFALCVFVTLINPYGLDLWRALRQIDSHTFAFLNEWKPPLASPAFGLEILLPLGLLCVAATGAWLFNPRRRYAHLLWLAFWIYSFCNARRHLWLLAIVCLVVLAANSESLQRLKKALRISSNQKRAQVAILVLLLLNFFIGPMLNLARAQSDLPVALCNVLDKYNPPGRMFNGFINAAYLTWRCGGRRALFIDHLQAHPDALIDDYQDIINATPRGIELLKEREIGYVILHNPLDPRLFPPLKDELQKSPAWELVFFDETAVMWVRKTPEYAALRADRNQHIPADLQ